MITKGLDWSFARPPIAEMPKWGYTYAFRYLCYRNTNTLGKVLTLPELNTILSVMDVWANWEWYDTRAKEGHLAGLLDGHEAHTQLVALNWPIGAYVIVSDDSATNAGNIAAVLAYLDGFQQNCPGYVVTVYGNDYVVDMWYTYRQRKGWQTLAWSGGRRSPHAFAYQNGNKAFNDSTDENEIYDTTGSYKNARLAVQGAGAGSPHPVPVPLPPLPIHRGVHMNAFLHIFGGDRHAKGWPGVWLIRPDLTARQHVNDVQSLTALIATKQYPTSGLSDAQVLAIPIAR